MLIIILFHYYLPKSLSLLTIFIGLATGFLASNIYVGDAFLFPNYSKNFLLPSFLGNGKIFSYSYYFSYVY